MHLKESSAEFHSATLPVEPATSFWSMYTIRKYRNDALLLFCYLSIMVGITWLELQWKMSLKDDSDNVFYAQLQTSIIWRCLFSYLSIWVAVLPNTLWHWPTELFEELRKNAAPKQDVWNEAYLQIVALVGMSSLCWGFFWAVYTLVRYGDEKSVSGTGGKWGLH